MRDRTQLIVLLLALTLVSPFATQMPAANMQEKPMRLGRSDDKTFVGMVSDSSCGAKHKMTDKTAEDCARTCIHDGAGYVLVAADTVFRLEGHANELNVLAGQKAKVTGTLHGETIRVERVEAAR